LPVQVWYPTLDTEGDTHTYAGVMPSDALDEAVPACESVRPVLLFSHGNGSTRWLSKFLGEFLATHGWIMVAPDHTGNTLYDLDARRLGELIFRRPIDLSDSADWLFADTDEIHAGLGACVDPDAGFAVAGHSFGGFTSAAIAGVEYSLGSSGFFCGMYPTYWLCDDVDTWVTEHPEYATWDFSDERVWATIPMAPAGYEVLFGGLEDIEVPALVLGGSLDMVTSMDWSVNLIYDAIGSEEKYLAELHGAGHSAFMNICELWPESDECSEPYIEQTVAHTQIQSTVLAFLRLVQGDATAADYLPLSSDLWTFDEGPR
jgi:predicted dienelactone hydrolase